MRRRLDLSGPFESTVWTLCEIESQKYPEEVHYVHFILKSTLAPFKAVLWVTGVLQPPHPPPRLSR